MTNMTSTRPYLIRAIYEWLIDNDHTPHLLVDAEYDDVVVPQQFVHKGRIVLNISPSATRNMVIGNDEIVFSARFSGKSTEIFIPPAAVLSIYSKESNLGMEFQQETNQQASNVETTENQSQSTPVVPPKPEVGKRPKLTVVK